MDKKNFPQTFSITFSYSSLMRDAFIQLRSMLCLCYSESLSYFSCILNSLLLYLPKFRQHFALIFRYARWKQWHVEQSPQLSMHPKNKMKCSIRNFFELYKRECTYTYESTIKKSSQTVQMDNSRFNTSINPNCLYKFILKGELSKILCFLSKI